MRKITARHLACLLAITVVFPAARAADDIRFTPVQLKTLGIVVAQMEPAPMVLSSRFPARVVIPPAQERVVSASQSGLVEALLAAVGDKVSKGQALATLRSTELVTEQGSYLQALTQVRLAQSELARDEQLFKDGIIAERRYLTTRSRHEELASALNEHRQTLRLAGMDEAALRRLEQTRALSGTLTITAPIAGIVLEQKVVAGQRVDRLEPLYRMARLDALWLELRVPQERVNGLNVGQRVEVPAAAASGRLIMIGRDVDPENQTVLLRAEITRGTDRLRPGQFIEAQLSAPAAGPRYSVPVAAVARGAKQSVIFVQTAQGFRAQPVQIVSEQNGHSVIAGELRGDERVAVRGVAAVKGAWTGLGGGGHE